MYSSNGRRDGMQSLGSSLMLALIRTNWPLRAPQHPSSPRKGTGFFLGFSGGMRGWCHGMCEQVSSWDLQYCKFYTRVLNHNAP